MASGPSGYVWSMTGVIWDAVGIEVGDDGQGFDLAVEDWAWAPLSSMGTNRPCRGHLAHRHRTR